MKSETIKKSGGDPASSSAHARRFAHADAGPVRGWIVTALFVLAVFYTLYLTRDLTLPIVLALLLHFLLRPVVRALQRLYIPARLGAALVVGAVVAVIAVAGYVLSDPIAEWLQKAPQIAQQFEQKLRPIREKVEEVNKAAAQVEQMTNVEAPRTPTVQVRPPANVRIAVWAKVQPLLTGIVVMFFLLYFLLATGEQLIARFAKLAATREGAREIVDITDAVERTVSRYLVAVTLINAGLGTAAAVITWAFGMPNPLLWGVLAMLLNFIPYLGSTVTLAVLTVVAVLSFDTLSHAFWVPACFLVAATLEGQLITPYILGVRLALDPIVVFLGLIFWLWLWGPAGALLAVPVLVTMKIIFDHVPPLAAWSALLTR